jgi:hypothetical protein
VQSVEHPCHQCHSIIEDGIPFCPKCGAPQIRVAAEEIEPPAPQEGIESYQPSVAPSYSTSSTWANVAALQPGRINWRAALPGAAVAGLTAGILSQIPYSSRLSVFWLLLAGGFAVKIYRQRTGTATGAKAGAKIGAFAGIFAFIISAIATAAAFFVFPDKVRDLLQKSLDNSLKNADPQSAKMMQTIFQNLQTPEGLVILLVLLLIMLLIFQVLLTAAGGAVSAAISKRNHPV